MASTSIKDLPLTAYMKVAERLVRPDATGKYTYNLVLKDPDGTRVTREDYWLTVDNGKVTYGDGHSDDPEATVFTVLKGGLDTLIAMQVFGLKAAMNAMMLGYITSSHLKRAEAWFKLFETGEEAVRSAASAAGYELQSVELDIYKELMLA